MIFIDESAANERTMDRKFGWSKIGSPCIEKWPAKRSERWSILPAYTLDGYIAYKILHGSYTKELFNTFIEMRVLPLCNPFPGERSVLIMDNTKIHHSEVYSNKETVLILFRNYVRCVRQPGSNWSFYHHIHRISTQLKNHLLN